MSLNVPRWVESERIPLDVVGLGRVFNSRSLPIGVGNERCHCLSLIVLWVGAVLCRPDPLSSIKVVGAFESH